MADYEMEKDVYELNFESARLAREAAEEATAKNPAQPRFVMGSLGPTNRTGSISPVSLGGVGVCARDDVVENRGALELARPISPTTGMASVVLPRTMLRGYKCGFLLSSLVIFLRRACFLRRWRVARTEGLS